MEDTATLARQEQEKQGPWEVEVSYGGEVDLHRHLTGCNKNPGHHKFVPVDQFNVDHLPPGFQDNDLVDLVRAMSDLTVRVSVKYVSEARPETVPGSDKPYPCYKNRGSNMMRVGTGWAWSVIKHPYPTEDDRFERTCPCQECRISPTPKTQFVEINITTATHVVYDSLEAAHTTCHLFFDKGVRPDACSGVVTLSGGIVEGRNVEDDWCRMIFTTHDLDLADRLDTIVYHRANLRDKLDKKWNRVETGKQGSSSPAEDLPVDWNDLIILVSHPHGCSKQISVGYRVDKEIISGSVYPRTYSTATCPGSSGAWVWEVQDKCWGDFWGCGFVHNGNCEGNKDLNFCSNYHSDSKITV